MAGKDLSRALVQSLYSKLVQICPVEVEAVVFLLLLLLQRHPTCPLSFVVPFKTPA